MKILQSKLLPKKFNHKLVLSCQGFCVDLEKDEQVSSKKNVLTFQGTDITEAFESHHISPRAGEMLENFYVSNATDPRNYFYTYEENGFYRTLKKRVASKLKTVDMSVTWKSRAIHDVNFAACLLCSIMVNRADSRFELIVWALLAGQFLAWMANFSHNFLHQADNWRMYTSNISFLMWRDVRVFHVLVSKKWKKKKLFSNSFF